MNSPEQNLQPEPEKQEKSMREIVLAEMEESKNDYAKKNPDAEGWMWQARFYANFYLNLFHRQKNLEEVEVEAGKPGLFLDDKFFFDSRYSERLQNMTPREFYSDIIETMKELNLDLKQMRQIFAECKENNNFEKLFKTIFPLYLRLREKGYAHYPDLTG